MNFPGFSPESFEQLIRTIALRVFGPGVTVFGNGPDGGREASFHGEVPYPHPPSTRWSGYGVVQAKFKQRIENAKADQAWARRQLELELEKWKVKRTNSRRPEYYIFCTNVELSSNEGGGRDRLHEILSAHKFSLGIKDYAIWDSNQIIGFVDLYPEIRTRFSNFFATGDLLQHIAKMLMLDCDAESLLGQFLCKEVVAEEDAKLSQAGDRSEDRIRLASVFLDLPCAQNLTDDEDTVDRREGTLNELLTASAYKLDPIALAEQQSYQENWNKGERIYGRYLFLGGPGSGKSTIGQFFSQIHRAALLDRRPPHTLEPTVRQVIKAIRARVEAEGLKWPATPRYPFRIELNNFAKVLAQGDKTSSTISQYLRARISLDLPISHQVLREWLRCYPILLILDGLDEVPSSSNRRDVIIAIKDFINEARQIGADMMIVSSSRRDGYSGEFDDDEVAHRYLTPLSKEKALICAHRYVNAKIASTGQQRADEAMEILRGAIESPLVEKLMRSPLQVTFMVTVVSASGKPSESRWQLFNDYYRIIYERELHKAVRPFDIILNERRQDIDTLHHTVGFVLQFRSESIGNTQADLSHVEFNAFVQQCLKENGLSESELIRESGLILEAARLRLVFLTSKAPGRLSFDVRSIQEYMAAACITNLDSTKVFDVLETISWSAYWRNTLLFAIGRFFAEAHLRTHRDKIRLLCEDLNRKNTHFPAIKVGSWLALEILESGTIGNVPLFMRSLAGTALSLLGSVEAGGEAAKRLSEIYDDCMENEYTENLLLHLGQADPCKSLTSWMLVFFLYYRNISWAKNFVSKRWPVDSKVAWDVLRSWIELLNDFVVDGSGIQRCMLGQLETEALMQLIPYLSIDELTKWNFPLRLHGKSSDVRVYEELLDWIFLNTREKSRANVLMEKEVTSFEITFTPLPDGSQMEIFNLMEDISNVNNSDFSWKIASAFKNFYFSPTQKELAKSLFSFSALSEPSDWDSVVDKLAWPARCCLEAARNNHELSLFAQKLNAYSERGTCNWMDLERDWLKYGIDIGNYPLEIFVDGPAVAGAILETFFAPQNHVKIAETVKYVEAFIGKNTDRVVCRALASIVVETASSSQTWDFYEPAFLRNSIIPTRDHWDSTILYTDSIILKDSKWYDFFDFVGRLPNYNFSIPHLPVHILNFDFYALGFNQNPSRLGLLRSMGFYCAAGAKAQWKVDHLINADIEKRFRLAAALIRLSDTNLTKVEAKEIADSLPSIAGRDSEPNAVELIILCLEKNIAYTPSLEFVLDAVINIVKENDRFMLVRAYILKQMIMHAARSGFDEHRLSLLGLPSAPNEQ